MTVRKLQAPPVKNESTLEQQKLLWTFVVGHPWAPLLLELQKLVPRLRGGPHLALGQTRRLLTAWKLSLATVFSFFAVLCNAWRSVALRIDA